MSVNILKRSSGDEVIQAFPLTKDKVNLTTGGGALSNISMIHCVASGTFGVIWERGGSSDTITVVTGEQFAVKDAYSVTLLTGTFHIA